jgi:molybdate transport system substrate-binding protein
MKTLILSSSVILFIMVAYAIVLPSRYGTEEIKVAAASDLQFAFTEIGTIFEQQTGNKVTFIFGSTGQLAQQIENGAPFDIFAAANVTFIDSLSQKNLVIKETITPYARGRIVLAINRQSGITATTLAEIVSLDVKMIAIANPGHAPYGMAAKQALQTVGVWEKIQSKIVFGENVRQTAQYVQNGDAQVGIIALSVANVPEITWTLIDSSLHEPIDQSLAIVANTHHEDVAQTFIRFINSPLSRRTMQKYGFILPNEQVNSNHSQ